MIGEIDSLDSSQVPTGLSQVPSTIDISTVATAMLSMDRHLTGHMPVTWLRRNLIYRIRRSIRRALSPKRG